MFCRLAIMASDLSEPSNEIDDSRRTLLTGGQVIDGTGADPRSDAAVLVDGDRITAVGPESELDYEADETAVVDVGDRTIMPGLVDAHTHITIYNHRTRGRFRLIDPRNTLAYNTIRATESAESFIEGGVTTIRECCGRDFISVSVRDAVEEGRLPGPRILPSGPLITITAGLDDKRPYFLDRNPANGWEVNGVDEVVQAVREHSKAGVSNIKLDASGAWTAFTDSRTPTMSERELAAAAEEARKFGITTACHAHDPQGIKNAARANVTSIEHGSFMDEEGLEIMLENDIYLVPTLASVEYFTDHAENFDMTDAQYQSIVEDLEAQRKSVKKAYDNGVEVAVGASSEPPGLPHGSTWREMMHFVEIGIPPEEAIVAGTQTAAELLGIEDETGTLEAGKAADILVVDGDPLEDIEVFGRESNPALVMKQGSVAVDNRPADD
jgi:imidazolonepropionase-like amidohydrolase